MFISIGDTNFVMNGVMHVCGFLFKVEIGFFWCKVKFFYIVNRWEFDYKYMFDFLLLFVGSKF